MLTWGFEIILAAFERNNSFGNGKNIRNIIFKIQNQLNVYDTSFLNT